ncbi:hypothetical protein ACWGPD_20465 [Streptomyces hirsutus]|uniref:hypothetical protein n=1 Tax=Streptomyces hirsutus TaxID=35620 RepID=UPI003630C56A
MKTGTRVVSAVCETEVVVIKGADVVLECGGVAMVATRDGGRGEPATGHDRGTLLGKRYTQESSGLQVLCVKPGAGSLSVDGEALTELAAKKLPSSD